VRDTLFRSTLECHLYCTLYLMKTRCSFRGTVPSVVQFLSWYIPFVVQSVPSVLMLMKTSMKTSPSAKTAPRATVEFPENCSLSVLMKTPAHPVLMKTPFRGAENSLQWFSLRGTALQPVPQSGLVGSSCCGTEKSLYYYTVAPLLLLY
jgi:hypothetical protein